MELVKLMNMSNYQVNSRVRDSSATPSIQIAGAGANRPRRRLLRLLTLEVILQSRPL